MEGQPGDEVSRPPSPRGGWAQSQGLPLGQRGEDRNTTPDGSAPNVPNLVWGAIWTVAVAIGLLVAGFAVAMHGWQVHKLLGVAGGVGCMAAGVYFGSLSARIALRIRRLSHS